MLWLVLSRSGFCSTDRFYRNGPICVFVFWSKAGKFNICNQDSKKKVWKLSFFTLKLSAQQKLKRLTFFWNFKDGWRRRTFFKCKPLEVHFTIRNRVPYSKLLTNQAYLGCTGEYWPLHLVSKRLVMAGIPVIIWNCSTKIAELECCSLL